MVTFSKMTSAEQQDEALIHGDVLEAILSHLPLIQQIPASFVSKSWNGVVSSILPRSSKSKPWLILHTQRSCSPYLTKTHAYDSDSDMWIEIQQPSLGYDTALRSSQSGLLYMLSPSKVSFSFDPLHLTWHHAVAPRVWRIDPVVAVVGRNVVVAGGACDFEDDSLAVEIYDLQSQEWTKSESMPESFIQSSSSTWLSIASNDRYLFVMDKYSGVTHWFDPETNTWSRPYNLHPDRVFYSVIGFSDEKLVMIGVLGDEDDVEGLKLWEIDCESFKCNEIGEMPVFLDEKLNIEESQFSSIDVCMAANIAYIYIPSRPEEVIVCEFNGGGGCRWWSATNAVASDRSTTERVVFTCSKVGIAELQQASLKGLRFRVKK